MSMNFNKDRKPVQSPKKNNNKTIVGIIIMVVLVAVVSFMILHHVMSVQDSFDEAGIKFTKMDKGLLYSSLEKTIIYQTNK